ncbi:MAG: DUF3857 domain-containing protein [Candidatus Omnitrophica bacterium]|nr:DUF3857 domain-containing protein [Candidatus Omnitrophota bacterium]MDD5611139.1 DUF3857 domain-containing protein [Candidatus Omnitrophota bacterium]
MPRKINQAIFALLFLTLFLGCAKKIDEAKDYAEKSNLYYQKAVQAYAATEDHFDLGRLYYGHGDYAAAIEEFKASKNEQARKFLGIAYYKSGDYTDALEVFRKLENSDDAEYLFYYGLASERLNLYDQAQAQYNKIKEAPYKAQALERLEAITKSKQGSTLADLDQKTRDIILNAPKASNYAQAGALILYCDEKVEVTPQNTATWSQHYLVKILNDRGKEEFSEVQTEYDSTDEKVELEYARVIKPDGEVIPVGKKHIRDVSKYLNFPLYSNARVHIISFPEVAENAVLEYKIKTYQSQLINKKDFCFTYPLQSVEPIIFCKFEISVPEERRLHIKNLHEEYNNFKAELKPGISQAQGRKTYSWEFKDIPQIIPEQQMPPDSQINPSLFVSTFDSWDQAYQWWWKLAKDKITTDAAIKNKVAELTRGLKSDKEKAQAIYNFCAQDIRYVAVEYGQAGYEPHHAEEIFSNKYGDCKDQAILLVSMLKNAGLNAYPVLISTRENNDLSEDFPAVEFNHAIAAVELAGNYIFLDPTASTCAFEDLPSDDQARSVLLFRDDGYKIVTTPLIPAQENRVKEELKIKAGLDGSIKAQKESLTFGYYDQGRRYWLNFTPPKLIEDTLKEKIQEIAVGAELESYRVENATDLNKPTVINYNFKGNDYFVSAGDIYILPQLSSINTALVARESRHYPIEFDVLSTQEKSIEIKIPEGLKIRFLPPSYEKDSVWMKIKAAYTFDNGTLYFKEDKEYKKIYIPTVQYVDYKKFIEELANYSKQRVVLEKISEDITYGAQYHKKK